MSELYCAPGNAGIAELADCVPIDSSNIVEVADFAQTIHADLTVVGPELPMVLGIGDEFVRRGLPIFCPSRGAAEIEGSKAFAREFMTRRKIPSPRYEVCSTLDEAHDFVKRQPFGFPCVVKADGLAAGKGTMVVEDAAAARAAVDEMMADKKFGSAGAKLVMEEFLEGEEVSFLVLSDGSRVVPLASVQDHKRALDGDLGPNTGGMGDRLPHHQHQPRRPQADHGRDRAADDRRPGRGGTQFQGVLFAGLMITESGPKVLEFNARFGDPETQVIMARMRSDIVPILQQCASGTLGDTRIEWAKEPAVCVVLASRGYPDEPETGKPISGLDALKDWQDVVVYHAATKREDGAVKTVGGRVLGVTALGANLELAIARAYEAIERVSFEGMVYRKDIGARALAHLHRSKPA